MELNSETWNMSPENIFLGNVAFGLSKSDAWLPSYAFFRKKRGLCAIRLNEPPGIWLRQTLLLVEFMELNSETWNMSPENIFLGNVVFEMSKSDA